QQQQHITASLAISMAAAPAYVCEFSFQLRNCFDPRKDNVLSQRLLPDVGRDSQGPYSWQHECLDNTFKVQVGGAIDWCFHHCPERSTPKLVSLRSGVEAGNMRRPRFKELLNLKPSGTK
ncbi:unnamed protein product, partial [Durusdinium trenchii]